MSKKRKAAVSKKDKRKNIFISIAAALIIIAFLLFMILPNLVEEKREERYQFKKEGELVFTDSLGNNKVKIDIEVADTDYERQLGLMYRTEMEEYQGMLFIFPRQDFQSFWMRNTHIPLDIIFINSDKVIVTIHQNTIPYSDRSYPSSAPSQFVVEVNAGFTGKYNIIEGDKVSWMETRINL
jgi:uncharacterized protein